MCQICEKQRKEANTFSWHGSFSMSSLGNSGSPSNYPSGNSKLFNVSELLKKQNNKNNDWKKKLRKVKNEYWIYSILLTWESQETNPLSYRVKSYIILNRVVCLYACVSRCVWAFTSLFTSVRLADKDHFLTWSPVHSHWMTASIFLTAGTPVGSTCALRCCQRKKD